MLLYMVYLTTRTLQIALVVARVLPSNCLCLFGAVLQQFSTVASRKLLVCQVVALLTIPHLLLYMVPLGRRDYATIARLPLPR